MLGEYFVDQCLVATISINDDDNRCNETMQSVYEVLKWYKEEIVDKKETNEFNEKVDLVYHISQYRKNTSKFNFNDFIERISNGKYSHYINVLRDKKTNLEDEDVNEIINKIRSKRKICELLRGKKSIQNTLNDIECGNYIDEENIIKTWEKEINMLHNNMIRVTMMESRDKAIRLNLLDDDYNPVMTKLRESLDEKNSLRTGYQCIDEKLPSRGFEDRRLYLVGGSSGVGKSIFLVNLIANALVGRKPNPNDKKYDYYLYITAENLIDESLKRFYCCLTNKSCTEVNTKIINDSSFSFKPEIVSELISHKTKVEFHYVEQGSTTVSDIENLVRTVYDQSQGRLKAVVLDYLDLVVCDDYEINSDKRLAQGEVSRGLKRIAVTYNVPFITATQLNRSGYDVRSEPSLTQMGESMLKIDNSDFVLFLQNSMDKSILLETSVGKKEYSRVRMTILKNRNGSVGDTVHLGLANKLNDIDIFNYRFEELPSMNIDTSEEESADYSDLI